MRTLSLRVGLWGLIAAWLPVAAVIGSVALSLRPLDKLAEQERQQFARQTSSRVVVNVSNLVRALDETSRARLTSIMKVALHLFQQAGTFRIGAEKVEWTVRRDADDPGRKMDLPKMYVGDVWLGRNLELRQPTPIVDQVHQLVGGVCSVYQKANDAGDLVCIATNQEGASGVRNVGFLIPAVDLSGRTNPVVDSLKRGEQATGRVQAGGQWRLALYEPIRDSGGQWIGAIGVTVALGIGPALQHAIDEIVVGKSGEIMILGAEGVEFGRCLLSKAGKLDGSPLADLRDVHGRPYMRELLEKTRELPPGHVEYVEYELPDPTGAGVRSMLASVAYYGPWDWAVVSFAELNDFRGLAGAMFGAVERSLWLALAGGVSAAILLTGWYFWAARRWTRPLRTLGGASAALADGAPAAAAALLRESSAEADYVEAERIHAPTAAAAEKLDALFRKTRSANVLLSSGLNDLADASGRHVDFLSELGRLNRQIQDAVQDLQQLTERRLALIREISQRAAATRDDVEQQQYSVEGAQKAMQRLSESINDFSLRFALIQEHTTVADSIIEGASHLAEQANLLSVNAAVEAERAGEHGAGFLVVAREIRRLSDQSAAAAASSRRQIQQLHSAVAAGVMAFDRFSQEVRAGSESASSLLAGFPALLAQVRVQAETLTAIEKQLRPTQLRLEALERSVARLDEQTRSCNEDLDSIEGMVNRISSSLVKLTPEALWKLEE